ncbi:MAG: alpha/beta fold hydrolase [Actinomycetota bacterium]
MAGRHIDIADTKLYIEERGEGIPMIVLHGGPGLDHHEFGDYLDPLADELKLIFVDERSQGLSDPTPPETWTLEQHATDVSLLARALELKRYIVLGHSYGAFITLQHAVDHPGDAAVSIISSGVPSTRFLQSHIDAELAAFEPPSLRAQVTNSWSREKFAATQQDVESLLHDQLPFHFFDPYDPIINEYEKRSAGGVFAPDVLRKAASDEYGGIDVEDRLGTIPQPVLVLAGRYDRTCSLQAAEFMSGGIRDSELVVFEDSAHMTFVEENDRYLEVVRDFVKRRFK